MDIPQLEFSRSWKCTICPGEPEFNHPDMMNHLRAEHSIEPRTSQGTRQLIMCLDGSGFYYHTYEIIINGMKFMEYRQAQRAKKKKIEENA